MLLLRTMRADEYSTFLEYFIPDYAAEIAANYNLSSSVAKARVIREIEQDLPQGSETPEQTLVCIVERAADIERIVGYLWYRADAASGDLFICDFYVFSVERGRGYGKQTLAILEDEAKKLGLSQIKLRVAANNARAKHLYEMCGFGVTGINMSKQITSEHGDD